MTLGNTIENELWTPWLEACREIDAPVSEAQRILFERFYQLLIEANKTTNLTRITEPEDFLYRHLLDSLTIVPLIPPNAAVADIGSGAGFPALPLAVTRPDVTVVAVESVGKKCQFIQSVGDALTLPNLECRSERSEILGQKPQSLKSASAKSSKPKPAKANTPATSDTPPNSSPLSISPAASMRERMDVATARAVASLPVLLELCLPFVKVGGLFLAMKGLSYEAELDASKNALKTLGGRFKEVKAFPHPRLEGSRLLIFEKTAPTPSQYPRTPGLPAKKPL